MVKKTLITLGLILAIFIGTQQSIANDPPRENIKYIYIFSADWCIYCKILEKSVLPDDRIQKSFKNYKVQYIDIDKHKNILSVWKIKTIPEIVITEKLNTTQVKILERWKPRSLNTRPRSHEQNIRSLLKVLDKYVEKKT